MPLLKPQKPFEHIRFRVMGEQSPAHPKTFAFFQDFINIVILIDLNTLHEKHPYGQVTNATWAVRRASLTGFRNCRRMVYYVFTGFTEFRTASVGRSPADYLATWFDDFVPVEAMQRSNDPIHTLNATTNYLIQRLTSQDDYQRPYFAFLQGDDAMHYRLLASALLEALIPAPIHMMYCFGSMSM